MRHHSIHQPLPQSAKKGQRLAVAPSPLNGVKLELGFILLAGTVLWLAADSITADLATQLLLLLVFGLSAAAWLVWRTRRILQRLADASDIAPSMESDRQDHEAQ